MYYNCTKFWPQIRQSRARDRYEKEIKTISQCDLLILDDFGLCKLEGPDRLTLLEILEDRWGRASTVVVSQRPLVEWYESFGGWDYPILNVYRANARKGQSDFLSSSNKKVRQPSQQSRTRIFLAVDTVEGGVGRKKADPFFLADRTPKM